MRPIRSTLLSAPFTCSRPIAAIAAAPSSVTAQNPTGSSFAVPTAPARWALMKYRIAPERRPMAAFEQIATLKKRGENMPRPLHEQVIVITGASSGIGRLTALRFARAGAKVVLAARNKEALQTLEQEITNDGGTALFVPTDVGNWES